MDEMRVGFYVNGVAHGKQRIFNIGWVMDRTIDTSHSGIYKNVDFLDHQGRHFKGEINPLMCTGSYSAPGEPYILTGQFKFCA